MLPSPEAMGMTWYACMLASRGLQWWQSVIVEGLHEHSIHVHLSLHSSTSLPAVRKLTFFYPEFVYVCEILTFPSNCAEKNFWSKWRLLWQSVSLKDSRVNVLDCIFHSHRHDHLHVVFTRPAPFDCISVAVIEGHRQLTENDRLMTSNTVYREVLQNFKYINKYNNNK
jgi:hypothetical protein